MTQTNKAHATQKGHGLLRKVFDMDSIRIDTGLKRIAINDDPLRVIEFNPEDTAFAERFYQLLGKFEAKLKDYQARAETLDTQDVDEHGIPKNMSEHLALQREACEFMRGQIDALFGPETSAKAFGDTLNLFAFAQFFEGITPFIQATRTDKMAKYLTGQMSGRVMK
jgi:hypothetical protein